MSEATRPLAVVLPLAAPLQPQLRPRLGSPSLGPLAALILALLVGSSLIADAAAGPAQLSIAATLLKWTPLIGRGFLVNIGISVAAMALGSMLGLLLGMGRISLLAPVRFNSWAMTQFFRNAPWLVLLFYCMLLLPFEVRLGTLVLPLPDWLKAIFGLSLAVMANLAEIVRGALQSIPTGQWEAADSLAFSRSRTLWRIILPQCLRRMLPSWMNLYALLLVSTPLCSIVGVSEALQLTADALVAENRQELLLPMYSYLLLWFFALCYPIALATARLERRLATGA